MELWRAVSGISDMKTSLLIIEVPEKFTQLAQSYELDEGVLAEAIIYDFTLRRPRFVTLRRLEENGASVKDS